MRNDIVTGIMASQPHECAMCRYFCGSKEELLDHVVKVHRYESNFLVYCQEDGCGESFTNWESFKKHHFRKHSQKALTNTVLFITSEFLSFKILLRFISKDGSPYYIGIGMVPSIIDVWGYDREFCSSSSSPSSSSSSSSTNVTQKLK